jgi:hypothetical protein
LPTADVLRRVKDAVTVPVAVKVHAFRIIVS